MKQSRDGIFLIQEKGAGRDGRSVFVPRRRPESFRLGSTTLDMLMRKVRILPQNGQSGWGGGELESHADFSVTSKTFNPFLG